MAEVLVQFDRPVTGRAGSAYSARICGAPAEDGLWEGWIEFVPLGGGPTLRTGSETRQPNRVDLEYWSTGITAAYLEGALERARSLEVRSPVPTAPAPAVPPASPSEPPLASSPSPPVPARPYRPPRAVLDPFDVYAQGEDVLRAELRALSEGHLRNIIRVYQLQGSVQHDLSALSRGELAEMIVRGVSGGGP